MRVEEGTYEYENWPSRKPRENKRQKREFERKVIKPIERKVEHQAARGAQAVISAVTQGGTASKARTALNSGVVLAAGLASYYATTWLLNQLKRTKAEDLADLNLASANAYREARNELVRKLGVASWLEVPEASRAQLKASYDAALARNQEWIYRKRTAEENARTNISQYQRQLGR